MEHRGDKPAALLSETQKGATQQEEEEIILANVAGTLKKKKIISADNLIFHLRYFLFYFEGFLHYCPFTPLVFVLCGKMARNAVFWRPSHLFFLFVCFPQTYRCSTF